MSDQRGYSWLLMALQAQQTYATYVSGLERRPDIVDASTERRASELKHYADVTRWFALSAAERRPLDDIIREERGVAPCEEVPA